MIPFLEILILFLTGLLGGFSAGLLGIGGGAIYVIIFSEYFERKGLELGSDLFVKMLIANSIFSILFAGLSGTIKQIKIKNFYPKEILLTALPASISALLITYLLSVSTWYSKEKFTLFFIILLLPLMIKTLITKEEKNEVGKENKNPLWFCLSGLVSGVVTSLTGLGGGYLIIPIFSGLLGFPVKKAMSISLGAMTIVSSVLSVFYFFSFQNVKTGLPLSFGAISLYLTLPVIAGVLIFASFGVSVAHKISPRLLRICFFGFFLIVVGRMAWKMFLV